MYFTVLSQHKLQIIKKQINFILNISINPNCTTSETSQYAMFILRNPIHEQKITLLIFPKKI